MATESPPGARRGAGARWNHEQREGSIGDARPDGGCGGNGHGPPDAQTAPGGARFDTEALEGGFGGDSTLRLTSDGSVGLSPIGDTHDVHGGHDRDIHGRHPRPDIPEPGRVIAFPHVDPRRAEQLRLALDGVPLAVGMAAGMAQVLFEAYCPRRLAHRRLEQLRHEWHQVVDDAIRWALEGEAS